MLGNESMATRIARRRQKRHFGHTASRLSSSPPASISGAAVAPPDAPKGSSGEAGEAPSQTAAAPKSHWKMLSVAAMSKQADRLLQDALADEAQEFETLTTKFARLLTKEKVKVDDLVRNWDRNGDGDISKGEFRVNVRKLGMKDDDVRDIDGLFDSMDDDHSGSLELGELKVALRKLQREQAAADASAARAIESAEERRTVAEAYKRAMEDTETYERAEADLKVRREHTSISSRLGEVLATRNIKIGEVVTKWDKDGDGTVDPKEFRSRIKELGLRADPKEVDGLFAELDEDGSGELDIGECKHILKKLQDAAKENAEEIKALAKSVNELKKIAIASQKAATQAQLDDQEHRRDLEEQERAAEEAALARAAAKAAAADAKAKAEKEVRMARTKTMGALNYLG